MNILLMELPYVLVPLIIAWCCRRIHFSSGKTFILTGILIILYPLALLWLHNTSGPLLPGPLFEEHEWIVIGVNSLFCLPITLLLQGVFNSLLLPPSITNEDWKEFE